MASAEAKCDVQNFRKFNDMGNLLPCFDPVSPSFQIEEWISKMEEFGCMYEWDDVAMKYFALSKILVGVGKVWLDSLPKFD